MLESMMLRGSKVQIMPINNAHEKALLEEAVRKEVPTLTKVEAVDFWANGDWVYVFITTKVLWKKLRIFGLQRLYRYKDDKTGLEIVEDPGLDTSKLALMVNKEKQDLTKVEETFKEGVQSGVFNNLEVTIPEVHKINPMLYEQRIRHYDEFLKRVCGLLGTDAVQTHKLIVIGANKIYQLKVTTVIRDHKYDIRIAEHNQRFRFQIRPNPEGKFESIFDGFVFPEDGQTLMQKLKLLKKNSMAYNAVKQGIADKYGLVEANNMEDKQGFIELGAWENKLKSVHIEMFGDEFLQTVWINIDYHFRKSIIEGNSVDLTQIKMQKIYNPDLFTHDMEQFLERVRLLDESDALDPFVLLHKIEGFKNAVCSSPYLIWDCKDDHWQIFSLYLLDFPIPISIVIGYDFVTDRLSFMSLPFQGQFKSMELLSGAVLKFLEQLRKNWQQLTKPDEINQCARYEFPKLTAQAINDQVLPQFALYDVVFANRNDRYEAALYMGSGDILYMEPSGNYKMLEPSEHLKTGKIIKFIENTEFIVFRERQELTPEICKQIEDRLTHFPKKFIYYGFSNNSDEVILNIRWGITGSLETAFLFVMIRYLMEKNLIEKELMEYIHGIVTAGTDEARKKFLQENKHSIMKAVKRIKTSCSPQMLILLTRFDWLFEAQAY